MAAGTIGAAALGLAGMANAATTGQTPTGPGYSYSPDTYAKPAPTGKPGWHNHHGPARLATLRGSRWSPSNVRRSEMSRARVAAATKRCDCSIGTRASSVPCRHTVGT